MAQADHQADATPFIEFMLGSLHAAINDAVTTDPVGDPVSDLIACLLEILSRGELNSYGLIATPGLSHRPTFRKNYLDPALSANWIKRTQPDSPNSPTQRYRLSDKGLRWLEREEKNGKV